MASQRYGGGGGGGSTVADLSGGGFRAQGAPMDEDAEGAPAPTTRKAGGAAAAQPMFAVDREDRWRAPGVRIGSVRAVAAGGGTVVVATTGHVLRWSAADSSAPPEGAWGQSDSQSEWHLSNAYEWDPS